MECCVVVPDRMGETWEKYETDSDGNVQADMHCGDLIRGVRVNDLFPRYGTVQVGVVDLSCGCKKIHAEAVADDFGEVRMQLCLPTFRMKGKSKVVVCVRPVPKKGFELWIKHELLSPDVMRSVRELLETHGNATLMYRDGSTATI